jgi:hypothetical protein
MSSKMCNMDEDYFVGTKSDSKHGMGSIFMNHVLFQSFSEMPAGNIGQLDHGLSRFSTRYFVDSLVQYELFMIITPHEPLAAIVQT